MRPIKLVMTGFESYKDKTIIDFEQFGTKGLYLITGDTGAGKTTIFDAITFALYGEPSGADRDVSMLRSHFADENTPTEVALDFEANGKKYHIVRNPDYERKALRGEKTTKENANAVLEFCSESREPVSGIQKVKIEIENILNLKKEQFCRIAMIAQGSFQKLLLSKKDEKQALFRELFHTEKYQQLQETIKSDKSQAEKNLESLNLKLNEALKRIEVNEHDEKAEEIERIKKLPVLSDEDVRLLSEFATNDEKVLNEVINQIGGVEKELESINSDIQLGNTRLQLQNDLKTAQDTLDSKKRDKESLKQTLSQAEDAAKESPELEKQKNLLEASLKDYEEIAKEEKKLQDFESNIAADETKLDSKTKKNDELSDNHTKLLQELELLKDAGEKIGTLEAEQEKNSAALNDLEEIKKQWITLAKDKENLKLAQQKAVKVNSDYLEANTLYSEKLSLFNLEQAGILAEGLKEGECCPVCGSTEHPHLAVKSEKAPSQAEIEELKKKAEKMQKAATNLSVEAGQKKTAVEKEEENIDKQLKKYFENLTVKDEQLSVKIEEKKSALKSEEETINSSIKQERSRKARRNEIENQMPEIEKQMKNLSDEINQLQIKISADKATLNADLKKTEEKKANLKYKTLEEAENKFLLLKKQIENLKLNVENAKQNLSDCENEISLFMGKEESLNKQLSEMMTVDMEKLMSEKAKFTDKKNALNEQRDALNNRRGINLESIKSIEKLIPEIKKANEYRKMISALNDVAAGSARGKNGKPSLEIYVQMHCLDQINRRANYRLKTMTDNKYELRRRIEEDGSELGLDLNVKDFYTGRERNVQSLSGGEQFQASLALALGLADEIQESSGGIRLDAMFIDEGFGTLDPETLNKAMRALEDLSNGDKLVGIISHVEELESRIPKKIRVKKDDAGISRISLADD